MLATHARTPADAPRCAPPSTRFAGNPLASRDAELVWDDVDPDVAVAAHEERLGAVVDPLAGHQALQVVDARQRGPVQLEQDVLGPDPGAVGRRAGDDLDDLDAGVAP